MEICSTLFEAYEDRLNTGAIMEAFEAKASRMAIGYGQLLAMFENPEDNHGAIKFMRFCYRCADSKVYTKDDLKSSPMYIKDGFAEGKDLVVSVMSAIGEEQICALKDIGPK
ncbi:hypothetical protein L1987_03897 [Smallanthus sonchifolius]|uniref:Uncharacterized protein n=1 Tax=Smallanthus sonchifolius TaxID=185202 RepID=A0ACB9KBX9_9ASTR|nr:hypothetical protein L1987_03897 [Smallanthus sonchifolius]